MINAAERLKDAQIECRPALDVIRAFSNPGASSPSVLAYIDPPYVTSSCGSQMNGRKIYDHQMTDAEHLELLDVLEDFRGMVVLSGYPSPLYDELLLHWRRVSAMRVSAMAATEKGGRREEVLWINPRASEQLEGRLFQA